MQSITFRMEKWWGPTVWHRELYPVSWDRPLWKIKERECIYLYDWITLLHSRNWHNIVNQQYFNEKYLKIVQYISIDITCGSRNRGKTKKKKLCFRVSSPSCHSRGFKNEHFVPVQKRPWLACIEVFSVPPWCLPWKMFHSIRK